MDPARAGRGEPGGRAVVLRLTCSATGTAFVSSIFTEERQSHVVSVNRTFTVAKPIAEVVGYLSDFANAQAWDPGTVTCARLDSGPVKVGSTWKNVSKFRGRETALDYRLVTLDPTRLVFKGVNKTVTSTDDLNFTALPDGTRISYTANLEFSGIVKLFGWALKGEFEKLADQVEKQLPAVINAL